MPGNWVIPGTLDHIETEIVYMNLTGLCGSFPITVVESPTLSSLGQIVEQKNNVSDTLEFPADSFFDVFVEVHTPLGDLHNKGSDPIVMKCKIDAIPPFLCPYGANTQPDLWNAGETKLAGTIKHSEHTPKKTLEGPALYLIQLTCVEEGSFTVNVSATFTREAKDTVGPVADSVDINCNAPDKLPFKGDTDGDGCPDVRENLPKSEVADGGGRDYLDPWDFYDVTGDGKINLLGDVLEVIRHFAPTSYPAGQEAEYAIYDRGPVLSGNDWKMTAPDGKITVLVDVLGVIRQIFHDCIT